MSPTLTRPEAIAFDCDGLLMDTESCWYESKVQLCEERGLNAGHIEHDKLAGASVDQIARYFRDRFELGESRAEIERAYTLLLLDLVNRKSRAKPGALELLRRLSGTIPIAVASNAPAEVLYAALSKGELLPLVDKVASADDVARPKPAPDVYQYAFASMDVDPRRGLCFEDSPTGVKAAKASGSTCVMISSVAKLANSEADLHFGSLEDGTLRAFVEGWVHAVL